MAVDLWTVIHQEPEMTEQQKTISPLALDGRLTLLDRPRCYPQARSFSPGVIFAVSGRVRPMDVFDTGFAKTLF
jgi:hypothetical protein